MTTILIVEDSPANMKLSTAILEKAGYTVLQAVNAPDGIALARADAPDMILMDIHLPGMSGLEAIRILKDDQATRVIPVIAQTAFAMNDEEEQIRASCDGYLAKPFRYMELLAEVDRLLGNRPAGSA